MGLSFISTEDKEGASLIIIYDGGILERDRWSRHKDKIEQLGSQVYLLAIDEEKAEEVRDFYDLDAENLPIVLALSEDDEIIESWNGDEVPDIDQIIYTLGQY